MGLSLQTFKSDNGTIHVLVFRNTIGYNGLSKGTYDPSGPSMLQFYLLSNLN